MPEEINGRKAESLCVEGAYDHIIQSALMISLFISILVTCSTQKRFLSISEPPLSLLLVNGVSLY